MKTMRPAANTLERFAAIVGPDNAILLPEAMRPYLREWRDRWFGKASAVLRPGSVEEVARILAIADETETAIVTQGGNTGLVGGQIPSETGEEDVISLTRPNRTRAVDVQNNTITVEAGATLKS